MNKSVFIVVLMVTMAIANPADRRGGQQGRNSKSEGRQQNPEGQVEGYDQEDQASMTNKVLECKNILQQAGMMDPNNGGQEEQGGENETEGGQKKKGERMTDSANARRHSRLY